jgi:hypothetical protein
MLRADVDGFPLKSTTKVRLYVTWVSVTALQVPLLQGNSGF